MLLVVASRWRRGPLAVTLAIGTVSFLLAIWTVRIDRTPAFYAPWNRFWELLAGATLACSRRRRRSCTRGCSGCCRGGGCRTLPHRLACAAIAAGVWLIDETRVFPGLWVLLPVGGTFLADRSPARARG